MTIDASQPVYSPITGTPIASVWGQGVAEHVVQRFTSTTERDARWVSPSIGSVCVTTDTMSWWQHDGNTWVARPQFPNGFTVFGTEYGFRDANGTLRFYGAVVDNQIAMRSGVGAAVAVTLNGSANQGGQLQLTPVPPTVPNAVNGFIDSVGRIFRSSASTRKIKTDISDVDRDQLADDVLQLRPRSFRFKFDPTDVHLGFIAEENAEIRETFAYFGEDIEYDDDGREHMEDGEPRLLSDDRVPNNVNDRAMIAGLIALCQRQDEQIKALEARLDALDSAS